MVINWIMRKTVNRQRTGIRWDFAILLEDIDYTDNLLRVDHVQQKTARLGENAESRIGTEPTEVHADEG